MGFVLFGGLLGVAAAVCWLTSGPPPALSHPSPPPPAALRCLDAPPPCRACAGCRRAPIRAPWNIQSTPLGLLPSMVPYAPTSLPCPTARCSPRMPECAQRWVAGLVELPAAAVPCAAHWSAGLLPPSPQPTALPQVTGPGHPAGDFVLQGPQQHGVRGLLNLFGIESPGLTASLALARHAVALLGQPAGSNSA